MNNYLKYIKCGDILVSPSLNYKEQYALKCGECKEYFSCIDKFLNHFAYRCSRNDKAEYENILVKSEYECSASVQEIPVKIRKNQISKDDTIPDVCLLSSEIFSFKKEPTPASDHISHMKSEGVVEEAMEEELIDYPYSDDEFKESFVKDFINSEEKLNAFIAAYENLPNLWNCKLPKRSRAKQRPKDLQIISAQFKISINQVESVIRRLRLIYREQLKLLETDGGYAKPIRKKEQPPPWFMEKLHFLKPFMENDAIVKLDNLHPDVSPEQVIKLLNIYKRYPILWNTNLIENCCNNKRLEALAQMESTIEKEIGLKINQNSLKRYIRCIHYHFTREKRQDMSNVATTENRSEFYKHMIFLVDHVGPFKCFCSREFKSPLALKVHQSQHDGSIPLKCSMCNKDFRTTEAYMSHARRHMKDLKQECSECGKKFLKNTELEIHMRSHTGAKPFCCELCGASFRHNHAFATHKRRHEKKYLHNCSICSKGFYKRDHLDNHLRTHGILQDFICKVCGKGFKTNKTLYHHELTHEIKK